MKKLLALLFFFVACPTLKAQELSDIVFGTTTHDDAEKIIDQTSWGMYKYNAFERDIYKYLFNVQANYCKNVLNRNDCQTPFNLDNKKMDEIDTLFRKELKGATSQTIATPEILKALGSDKNINIYLHGIDKLSYKLKTTYDYYADVLKEMTGSVGGMQADTINQAELVSDQPAYQHNLFRITLDKLLAFGQDNTEIKKYLKGQGLDVFAQYLADHEKKQQQQQNQYVQSINKLAQGLNDIK